MAGQQDYDPLRRPVAAQRPVGKVKEAKNPFIRTISMRRYGPSERAVNQTLWGSPKTPGRK